MSRPQERVLVYTSQNLSRSREVRGSQALPRQEIVRVVGEWVQIIAFGANSLQTRCRRQPEDIAQRASVIVSGYQLILKSQLIYLQKCTQQGHSRLHRWQLSKFDLPIISSITNHMRSFSSNCLYIFSQPRQLVLRLCPTSYNYTSPDPFGLLTNIQ